ncbi:hypothetical protein PLESTB_001597700 [Pleodorina starrii]|uniref:Transmembrane protein n=1 Tax=Pleodorina starrii TaxID=330485 RepID=A0A9W6BXY4_9CHLO|nr:hypothetical protein PLESTM_001048500 [Pleodorina starrii]GLC60317.1 hypothetical protein PLESTB_001597700 [Pleodorina starrii]GLC75381.1 hypothetical protein PLESTF_001630700 [Pleodorina starrii]
MAPFILDSLQDAPGPGNSHGVPPQSQRRTWTNFSCRLFLQLEVAIIIYSGALSIISPAQWAEKVGNGDVGTGVFSDAALKACFPVARHGGACMFALAAALHIGLHSSSERVLEAVLYALLAGDAALLVALALMAADEGWRLNTTNTFGLVFTIVCVVVRLALLRDCAVRKTARPQRLAALAQELDSVQHVVRRSLELNALITHNVTGVDQAAAVNDTIQPPYDITDEAAFKED